jgi:hypothetical protein
MTKKAIERQQEIESLSKKVIERAQIRRGGSACLVPAGSRRGFYRVDLDENYRTLACECEGNHTYGHDCKHMQAARLYFVKKIHALRNNSLNPVYEFFRAGVMVRARLSQFSKVEKKAFREQERAEAEARRRAILVIDCDPCGLAA